jgi:type III secretion protein U
VSDGDSSEEKNLPPSPKKLLDARRKGQIARATELVSAAGMVAAIGYLWSRASLITTQWEEALTLATQVQDHPFDLALRQLLSALGSLATRTILPFLAVVVAAGLVASIAANRGFVFSLHPMMPKLEHLNPVAGLKRMFGLRSWVEFAKTLLKAALLTTALVLVLLGTGNSLIRLPVCGIGCVPYVFGSIATALLGIAAVFFLFAGLMDLLIQRWLFLRDMRMSFSEAKREHQETEGNPQIRGAHRRLRQEAAESPRVGVGEATILIMGDGATVGLRYVAGQVSAPYVVCRGRGASGDRLRAEAMSHDVPVIEDGPLAGTLLRKTKLGGPVPANLFERVARAFYAAGLA